MTPQRMVEAPAKPEMEKLNPDGVGDSREDAVHMSSAGTASQPIKASTPVKEKTECSKNRQGSESQPHKMRIDSVDFFYGKDHYFEDNAVYDRSAGINLVSSYLQLWPAS